MAFPVRLNVTKQAVFPSQPGKTREQIQLLSTTMLDMIPQQQGDQQKRAEEDPNTRALIG